MNKKGGGLLSKVPYNRGLGPVRMICRPLRVVYILTEVNKCLSRYVVAWTRYV